MLADKLKDWLPLVVDYAEPWLSQSDIHAGERWAAEVSKELELSNFGIICLTAENLSSPWILFESGALAKSIQESRVVPLLLNVDFKDVVGPLAQFQAKKVSREGIKEIIVSINRLSQVPMDEKIFNRRFDGLYHLLEEEIANIPPNEDPKRHRSNQDIFEELISTTRAMDQRMREMVDSGVCTNQKDLRTGESSMSQGIIGKLSPYDPLSILVVSSAVRNEYPYIYDYALDVHTILSTSSDESDAIDPMLIITDIIDKLATFDNLGRLSMLNELILLKRILKLQIEKCVEISTAKEISAMHDDKDNFSENFPPRKIK